ncbi:MAG TPA: lysine--tRNA ligase [Atribacterota bacterium]|nr:lysine--tRNA ligase [Atribacterota bacterium]
MFEQNKEAKSILSIREERIKEIEELRREGIDPFGQSFPGKEAIIKVIDKFNQIATGEPSQENVIIAGRIMALRKHGKAAFADLEDQTGKIQVYIKSNFIGTDSFEIFKDISVGDIIGITGTVFKTKTGELTVLANKFTLLTKTLRTLPEKWHGLTDTETRYRKRYLDLIANQEVKELFIERSKIVKYIRNFLDNKGFLEVETPVLQPIPGGATATPFVTHHLSLHQDLYLKIAPELYLKRLLVGGLEKVYELNRNFRNEGISTRHNPEFTMLELYEAYADYHTMMEIAEEMVCDILKKLRGTLVIQYQGEMLDFTPPWKRISMYEAIKSVTGINPDEVKNEEVGDLIVQFQLELPKNAAKGEVINELFEKKVEHTLIQPTFIIDYPVEVSPLSKQKPGYPHLVERFELFINSMEIANAFTELNDPLEQKVRFLQQAESKSEGEINQNFVDYDYIEALEYGMPPAGGMGVGIDRLIMLLTNKDSIREVILFPQLKKKD